MPIPSKRAEYVALACMGLAGLFFLGTLILGYWSGFFAVTATSWLILSAALISFVLVIQFHQRALAEQEKLDLQESGEGKETTTIFEQGSKDAMFAVAQRRLGVLEKWFIPVFGALIAAYQIGLGIYIYYSVPRGREAIALTTQNPLACAIIMTAFAFVGFLFSRYATGLSVEPKARPLRAAGSSLLGASIFSFALAVGLALEHFGISEMISAWPYIMSVVLVLLGIETGLNVILDIYRPRIKGQYSRAPFDSRLLGLLNEPEGFFRTAAQSIDYQFGFKVSQTWFYQLMERAIIPLVIFGAIVLYLLSCFVVVQPDEEAILERFGNARTAEGDVRRLGPGLSFKWPWPVDIVYKYPTKKISEISVGYVPKDQPGQVGHGPILWGEKHYEEEYKLLTATGQVTAEAESSVPVSIVQLAMPVQYRVKDLYEFLYNHNDSQVRLEAIAYRELTKFASSAKIEFADTEELGEISEGSLLGAGRSRAKKTLTRRIQEAADQAEIGVEVVFVGLQGIHPPVEVAADYQEVIGSVQTRQADILKAYAERIGTLSSIAGSVPAANQLYDLAAEYKQAEEDQDMEKVKQLGEKLDESFSLAEGDIFEILRRAQAYSFERVTLAEATGQRFQGQLKAYRASKDYFKKNQKLQVLENALDGIRKFVIAGDPNQQQVFIIDLQEKLTPSLYDIGGLEEASD